MKIKVGLYFNTFGYKGVDLSQPEKGNIGIGGTQFNFIALPYYYDKYFDNVEFIYLTQYVDKLPIKIGSITVKDDLDAVIQANNTNCDIFIFRPQDCSSLKLLCNKLKNTSIKAIAWEHNFPSYKKLNIISKFNNINRYVLVSNEVYDSIRDHRIIYKSQVIHNGIDLKNFIAPKHIKKSKIVVYLGRIDKKGLPMMLKAWRRISVDFPDARLIVIGGKNLYSRELELGPLGIANVNFEKKYIIDNLLTPDGNLLKTVKFTGLLGSEKIKFLQEAMVGVINPTGVENCPGSALEFQACSTPVVCKAKWGLLETVLDKHTGLLGNNNKDFIMNIKLLLNDEVLANEMGINGKTFVENNFNYNGITSEWRNLFEDIMNDNSPIVIPYIFNGKDKIKFLKEKIRVLKNKYPILTCLPALKRFEFINKIYDEMVDRYT